MEGLIPMVYRSLKRNKIRRSYECLSSGTAAQPYNIKHHFDGDHHHLERDDDDIRGGGARHQRCSSIMVDCRRSFAGVYDDDAYDKPKQQLVRFRSHRMLSCLSAAA